MFAVRGGVALTHLWFTASSTQKQARALAARCGAGWKMDAAELILLFASVVLVVRAYLEYYIQTASSEIAPNRWSWLIWTTTVGVEVFTFQAVSNDFATTAVFAASFVACCAITILVWGKSSWRTPSATELACVAASVGAIAVCFLFQDVWVGHLIALVAIPISFAPTYVSAWQDYRREQTSSWMWWTLGDLCALGYVLLRFETVHEIPYAGVEAMCHGIVWYLLRTGKLRAWRGASSEDAAWLEDRADAIEVRENHLGKAVFAAQPFEPGALIMTFGGKPTPGAQIPKTYLGAADRYMQIDHDLYLGPSGRADDYVNHSCNPNAGIRFASYGVFLVALRPIAAGEEITWDYSTTMHQNDWVMRCDCRDQACRGYVGQFLSLTKERRTHYLSAGVVAPYIVKWIEGREREPATVPVRVNASVADLQASVAAFAASALKGEAPAADKRAVPEPSSSAPQRAKRLNDRRT